MEKENLTTKLYESIRGKTSAEIKSMIRKKSYVDSSEYADVEEYRMCNFGDFPSGDYYTHDGAVCRNVNFDISDEVAEVLAFAAADTDDFVEFCKKIYQMPIDLTNTFPNCSKISVVKELSKKQLETAMGGKFIYKSRQINRPRFFLATSEWHDSSTATFYMLQPDRRKNSFEFIGEARYPYIWAPKLILAGKVLVIDWAD